MSDRSCVQQNRIVPVENSCNAHSIPVSQSDRTDICYGDLSWAEKDIRMRRSVGKILKSGLFYGNDKLMTDCR